VRIDHVFGPRFTLFGRFKNDDIPTIDPGGLFSANPLPGVSTTSSNSPGRILAIHAANAFSSTLINDGGYSYSHGIIGDTIGLDASQNSPDVLTSPRSMDPARTATSMMTTMLSTT
jgi:hypothetical protein